MKNHNIDKEYRMNDTKMLWHMDRVKEWEQGKRIAPLYIDMGATKTCNAKCVYCYGAYQQMTNERIEKGALIDLFYRAPLIGIKGIGLVGDGEPTCNPYIYDAMDAGKLNSLDMAISTNGILLDESKMHNILRNCTWMRFNLSAGTKEGYKKIHNVDCWDKVSKNIETMVKIKKRFSYDCDIGLQAVYVPGLMDKEMKEESKLAVDKGVDYFLIKQCSLPENNKSVNKVSFDIHQYNDSKIQDILEECENMSNYETNIIVKWKLMEQEGKRPYNGCLGIPFLCQISGNGKVYPCGHLFGKDNDKYLMGDLHKNNIEEIIKSDRYWKVVEHMKKFNVHVDCHGACRQDKVNEFLYDYIHPPKGINFI